MEELQPKSSALAEPCRSFRALMRAADESGSANGGVGVKGPCWTRPVIETVWFLLITNASLRFHRHWWGLMSGWSHLFFCPLRWFWFIRLFIVKSDRKVSLVQHLLHDGRDLRSLLYQSVFSSVGPLSQDQMDKFSFLNNDLVNAGFLLKTDCEQD